MVSLCFIYLVTEESSFDPLEPEFKMVVAFWTAIVGNWNLL